MQVLESTVMAQQPVRAVCMFKKNKNKKNLSQGRWINLNGFSWHLACAFLPELHVKVWDIYFSLSYPTPFIHLVFFHNLTGNTTC